MTHETPLKTHATTLAQYAITKADRDLYKYILDAPFATCVQINNMRDDTPELQAIAKHRIEASHRTELVKALNKLASKSADYLAFDGSPDPLRAAMRGAEALIDKIGGDA